MIEFGANRSQFPVANLGQAVKGLDSNGRPFGVVTASECGAGPAKTASYNRGALQDMLDAAATEGRRAIIDIAGDVHVDAALVLNKAGLRVSGASLVDTRLIQDTATEHMFVVAADAYGGNRYSSTATAALELSDMELVGVGQATATGDGVHIDGTIAYVGQLTRFSRVEIRGFARGIYDYKGDQVMLLGCNLLYKVATS